MISRPLPVAAEPLLRSPDYSDLSLAPKGPHSPRGPRATAEELHTVFTSFDLNPESVRVLGALGPQSPRFHAVGPDECLIGRRFESLDAELSESGAFLLAVEGRPDDRRLAMWRNALWPLLHVGAVLRVEGGKAKRVTLGGTEKLEGDFDFEGAVLFARRTSHVMSQDATVEKFDRNASNWDGTPGGAGYPHFRWMRRFVGRFGHMTPPAREEGTRLRVLDFGCGAGWVGIEAAKVLGNVHLSSFDPSPEMVKITEANARAAGIDAFEGRTGFGEDPPFGADKSEPFDVVFSSGVASFSPDIQTWLDGLVATLRPGADLIIGDIHPSSKGFERRRRRKPLLPVREMNAFSREEIRKGLEVRGLVHVKNGAYQLTRPIPEAMHVNETKLKGLLTYPLLWANRVATWLDGSFGSPMQDRFDSWVMHLGKPEVVEQETAAESTAKERPA